MFLKNSQLFLILTQKKICMVVTCLFASLLFLGVCNASDNVDPEKIYKQAQDVSNSMSSKLNDMALGGGGIEKFDEVLLGKGDIKNKAEDLGKLPQEGDRLKEDVQENPEEIKCTIEGCNVAAVMGSKAMHERESKLEALGFKKDKDQFPEDNKGQIEKANYNLITKHFKLS